MRIAALIAGLTALLLPGAAAMAQDSDADAAETAPLASAPTRQRIEIVPYIEAAQVLTAELSPGNDVVTYTMLAAGVDGSVVGRNSAASASLRYERRFDYGDHAVEGDTLSGVARASVALAPRVATLEGGLLGARTRVDGNSASPFGGEGSTSQIYAAYVGPSVHTMTGNVEVEGHYFLGYTRVESPDALVLAPGAGPVDVFDESVSHTAYARAGVRPGVVLPVGVGLGGGWNEHTVSNLDQRIRDRYLRGDVTVPVTRSVALVGGVGYEDVEVSSRDALRDGSGNPVVGSDGRYVTDKAAPRRIAYQTDGLIWDAGVLWRPSRRTSLEAHVGRRYGSTTVYGSFAYAPDSRSSFNLAVYDGITSFGGALVDTLSGLPAEFDAFRNAITGEIGGCVAGPEGDGCFAGALGSMRSAVFRNRGLAASYSVDFGRTQIGAGVGYDRRKFIAAAGTVLAPLNGVTDESVWLAAYAGTRLDERSSLSANANVRWYESGLARSSDTIGYSSSLAYSRRFLRGLSGTAAVGLDGISRENLPDLMAASALLGLRYSFL
jgi:hypothetical protein